MNNHYELRGRGLSIEDERQELRNAYLCGCRLLQWIAERLSIDRRSSMMRGMDLQAWDSACRLLIRAGVIDSRLVLLMGVADGLFQLRSQFDMMLKNIEIECAAANSTAVLDDPLFEHRAHGDIDADGTGLTMMSYASCASSCPSSMVTASATIL